MKKVILTVLVIFFITQIFSQTNKKIRNNSEPVTLNKKGTAIIITGAAAKIGQEAALLEHLYLNGMLNDVVFISGASSGALNSIVLNAILEKKYTWDSYRNVLFNLNNDDIFRKEGNKLPVDTSPFRNLLKSIIVDTLGYITMSDLPYPTSISVVNSKVLTFADRTYRLCNMKINPESDPSLNLLEVLMASTSYPIAFPPALINNLTTIPKIPYIDGGIAADHVPYEAVLEFEKANNIEVEKIIIISRKRDILNKIGDEAEQFGISRFEFFDKLGVSPEAISQDGFVKRLISLQKKSPSFAARTFVYVPDFPEDFLMFDFTSLRKQYELTISWAKNHEPVSLTEYLKIV